MAFISQAPPCRSTALEGQCYSWLVENGPTTYPAKYYFMICVEAERANFTISNGQNIVLPYVLQLMLWLWRTNDLKQTPLFHRHQSNRTNKLAAVAEEGLQPPSVVGSAICATIAWRHHTTMTWIPHFTHIKCSGIYTFPNIFRIILLYPKVNFNDSNHISSFSALTRSNHNGLRLKFEVGNDRDASVHGWALGAPRTHPKLSGTGSRCVPWMSCLAPIAFVVLSMI